MAVPSLPLAQPKLNNTDSNNAASPRTATTTLKAEMGASKEESLCILSVKVRFERPVAQNSRFRPPIWKQQHRKGAEGLAVASASPSLLCSRAL